MSYVEKRIESRISIRLRADAKELSPDQLEGIMDGQGWTDIFVPSFSYKNPREGMQSLETRDISRSGLRLEGSFGFNRGASLAIDLHLPGDRVLVKALLEVMWVEKDEKNPEWKRAGARFAALEETNSHRIGEFLARDSA